MLQFIILNFYFGLILSPFSRLYFSFACSGAFTDSVTSKQSKPFNFLGRSNRWNNDVRRPKVSKECTFLILLSIKYLFKKHVFGKCWKLKLNSEFYTLSEINAFFNFTKRGFSSRHIWLLFITTSGDSLILLKFTSCRF